MYAQESWELRNRGPRPGIFITGMVLMDESLIVAYGVSDEPVGVVGLDFNALVKHVRMFDARGKR